MNKTINILRKVIWGFLVIIYQIAKLPILFDTVGKLNRIVEIAEWAAITGSLLILGDFINPMENNKEKKNE